MSNSPHEYVEELRAHNKILRANVLHLVHEKHVLEEAIADLYMQLRKARLAYMLLKIELG